MRIAVVGSRGKMGNWHKEVFESLGNTVLEVDSILGHGAHDIYAAARRCDAAVIASPTSKHAEHARTFLTEHRPILIEKPIAQTLYDARRLRTQGDFNHVPIAVGYLNRFNPAFHAFQYMMYGQGELTIHRIHPLPTGEYGGVAIDLASHDIDLLRMAYGADLRVYRIEGATHDLAQYSFFVDRYGVHGSVTAQYLNPNYPNKVRQWVWQGREYAMLDLTNQKLQVNWEDKSPQLQVNQLYEQAYAFIDLIHGNTTRIATADDGVIALRDALGE